MIKLQLVKAVRLAETVAAINHVLLQIQTDNAHLIAPQLMKIIIHGKGQIGFSAAEINNNIFPALIQSRKNVFDEFQEPVDLPEFVVAGTDYLPLRGHDA